MTNRYPDVAPALELKPGAHWDGVIRDPFPWAGLFMLLAFAIVVISGVILVITRKRKGRNLDSVSPLH